MEAALETSDIFLPSDEMPGAPSPARSFPPASTHPCVSLSLILRLVCWQAIRSSIKWTYLFGEKKYVPLRKEIFMQENYVKQFPAMFFSFWQRGIFLPVERKKNHIEASLTVISEFHILINTWWYDRNSARCDKKKWLLVCLASQTSNLLVLFFK